MIIGFSRRPSAAAAELRAEEAEKEFLAADERR
jgi:hypothetical protein